MLNAISVGLGHLVLAAGPSTTDSTTTPDGVVVVKPDSSDVPFKDHFLKLLANLEWLVLLGITVLAIWSIFQLVASARGKSEGGWKGPAIGVVMAIFGGWLVINYGPVAGQFGNWFGNGTN